MVARLKQDPNFANEVKEFAIWKIAFKQKWSHIDVRKILFSDEKMFRLKIDSSEYCRVLDDHFHSDCKFHFQQDNATCHNSQYMLKSQYSNEYELKAAIKYEATSVSSRLTAAAGSSRTSSSVEAKGGL